MKKISIIIPVYDGEEYLERCLDSVLNQKSFSVDDIEIITINDGGKDNSLNILHRYQQTWGGVFRVYNQTNRGVARTRNRGIKLATGKYLMFVDQDDYVEPDYLHTMYNEIEKTGNDVVYCGYDRPDVTGRLTRKVTPKIIPKPTSWGKYVLQAAWAKIHRAEFVKKNQIEFFSNNIGEDLPFTIKEIQNTKKISMIDYVGYHWFYNEKSVSNSKQVCFKNIDLAALIKMLCRLDKQTEPDIYEYFVIKTAVYSLLFAGKAAKPSDFIKEHREIFRIIQKHFPNYRQNRHVRFGMVSEAVKIKVAISVFMWFERHGFIKQFSKLYCRG